jgi:hydroxyethylthiazole kinase-like uncharacterized protein yjeF
MKGLYSVAELRGIERAAMASLPPGTLMRRAGQAAGNAALELLGKTATPVIVHGQAVPALPVLVLAGPGNNGGDALEVAAILSAAAIEVVVVHMPGSDPSPETRSALKRAHASDADITDTLPAGQQWALVIDGLFGIGLARPLEGQARELAEAVNAMAGTVVLALDVPSGLDADSGAIVGPDGVAVRASHTITFIGDKPGLHTCEGRDHAGDVLLAGLGISEEFHPAAQMQLAAPAMFAHLLGPRAHNTHKGSFGDVAIVGGAHGMAGAAVLAARGALFSGAGRVYLAAVDPGPGFDSMQPELMFRDAASFDLAHSTVVAGPGMGDSAVATRALGKAIDNGKALVLDADALNLLAASPELQARLAARATMALLTPHPLEAARLLGVTSAVVQGDRLAAARELAVRLHAVVVLKGSGTIVAAPDGRIAINPTGNPGLATGGTGDVLAGLCGSLLAQGLPAWEAALAAVWMHGAAADRLVVQGVGPIGLTAGELPVAIRAVLNSLAMPGG